MNKQQVVWDIQIQEHSASIELHQECKRSMQAALTFKPGSSIGTDDLITVLDTIEARKEVKFADLQKEYSYTAAQLTDIITRLEKLGDVFYADEQCTVIERI